jgi:hypothetical protein
VDFPHAANTDGLADVDVAGDSCGADVEPLSIQVSNTAMRWLKVYCLVSYQSMLWGGSSLACEVLTVSLQPVDQCQHMLSTSKVPRPTRDSGISFLMMPIAISFFGVWCSRTWDGQTTLTLEEGGVGIDEFVRRDIAYGDTGHVGGVLS